MLRLEEHRQQAINLQQPLTRQFHAFGGAYQIAVALQLLEPLAERLQNVGAEFALEIVGLEPSCLQLQDHLADETMARSHRQGPAQRQLATPKHLDVLFPGIDILQMNTVDMAERSYPRAEHISAMP